MSHYLPNQLNHQSHIRLSGLHRRLTTIFALCFFLTFSFLFFTRSQSSQAVSYAGFSAGNIMSDATMSNYNAMSEADIANFMHSKNPCNDTDLGKVGYYLDLGIYHIENGHFVCLADESYDGESVPHIIASVAREYRINPQVILVLLEKEQGLISDTYPYHNQIAYAFGYGCDDTVGCHSEYAGFRKQVSHAASLFREVLDGGWTNYPIGWNFVKYHPNIDCGGTNVYIENLATSALYRYTPYQPNAAALAAGYGTGDACSSYGNRNFYGLFTDWFGNTHGAYKAEELGSIYIEDGIYTIRDTQGHALDVAGGSTNNGANIQIWDNNGSAAQVFKISRGPDGYYTIANTLSGKVVDIAAGGTNNGANIQLYDSNNSCAQKWAINNSSGRYIFRNACSGRALDIAGGNLSSGTNVQLWDSNQSAAQKWDLVNHNSAVIPNGEFVPITISGKALDVNGGTYANGTNVQIYHKNDSPAQTFRFERAADGLYTIVANGKYVLDVQDGSFANAANVQIYGSNGSCAQKWLVQFVKNHFAIRSSCTGMALDVNPHSVASSNVRMWYNNQTVAQKWDLIPPHDRNTFSSGSYNILNLSGKALDVAGGSTKNGANVQVYDRNYSAAQTFQVRPTSDGFYEIYNPHSDKVLDVYGGLTTNNTNVQIYGQNHSCAQKWFFQPYADGTYSIRNACGPGNALDVNPINLSGSNAKTWESNYSSPQRWTFVKVSE